MLLNEFSVTIIISLEKVSIPHWFNIQGGPQQSYGCTEGGEVEVGGAGPLCAYYGMKAYNCQTL